MTTWPQTQATLPPELWQGWRLSPLLLAGLVLAALLYGRGVAALWRRAGRGRGLRPWRALAFAGGMLALAAALLAPLDVLFASHMLQHTALALLAAPLLILGAPHVALLWALPLAWRLRLRDGLWRGLRGSWRLLAGLPVACGLYVAVFWLWHLPALYQLALESRAAHLLAHGSFLGTALLFWHAVGLGARRPHGAGILALFVAGVQNSLLSALILTAQTPWYAGHARNALLCNIAPLDDQRMAGLIMMLPCDAIYLGAALWLGAIWLAQIERRTQRAERLAGRADV
jgi:putative membrane protein